MFQLDVMTLVIALAAGTLALGLVAAGAAVSYSLRRSRLPAATRYENIQEKLAIADADLAEKQKDLAELDQQIKEQDTLAAQIEALKSEQERLQLALDELEPAKQEINEVKEQAAEVASELAERKSELQELEKELATRRDEVAELEAKLDPARIEEMEAKKAEVEGEISRLKTELDRLRPEYENSLKVVDDARRLETRLAVLEQEIENRQNQLKELGSGTPGKRSEHGPDAKAVIEDLRIEPRCLAAPTQLREAPREEHKALFDVAQFLKKSGLNYHRRTLYAFHTALKVNDTAQLTVLSGVSGTGKSLLPRRYAEAMGIHFLQISVEPRWDSPQDLLGFYNYVEGRYRATELARLLAHMDPWRQIQMPENTRDARNEMAMVLLDEMNLARVEYYFSEFLSRLEARAPWSKHLDQLQMADAMIPLDVRGLSEKDRPPMLFPAHNVLFVGTMNDDESTQSLSDKVLDRSNVLQFPAPSEFELAKESPVQPADEAQRFREWRSWITPGSSLQGASAAKARDVIERLAEIMEEFGRPFGHRLAQAITAYSANYPANGHNPTDVTLPLADQIEFRIMPKLRGVEIDAHASQFDELVRLLKNDLDDTEFADRLGETVQQQAEGSGLFVWRGLERGGGA